VRRLVLTPAPAAPIALTKVAMSKTMFDMGFVMADVKLSLPTASAED
jgi:hypothetical protein